MIRDWKKSFVLTSVLIASDIMLTDGICLNISVPSISRNKATGSRLDCIGGCSVCSPSHGVRFDHVRLFVAYHCSCVGIAQMVSCSPCMVPYITRLYIYVIVFILCPLLYRVSPAYNMAILSSVHYCSFSYYYPVAPYILYHFIPMYVLIVNA